MCTIIHIYIYIEIYVCVYIYIYIYIICLGQVLIIDDNSALDHLCPKVLRAFSVSQLHGALGDAGIHLIYIYIYT